MLIKTQPTFWKKISSYSKFHRTKSEIEKSFGIVCDSGCSPGLVPYPPVENHKHIAGSFLELSIHSTALEATFFSFFHSVFNWNKKLPFL